MKNNIKSTIMVLCLFLCATANAQTNDNWFNNENVNRQYGNASTSTSFNNSGNANYATNDFLTDYDEGNWSTIPGKQRVRNNNNDKNKRIDLRFKTGAPLTDGIPVLVVMLLGVAVLKYRKSH